MRIIGYARVSSEDQAQGFSLQAQEEAIIRFAKQKGHMVIKIYKEDHTAYKDFNRPEWNRIEEYCRKNKKEVDGIIFVRWDRFSRNEPIAKQKILEFRRKSIEIFPIENFTPHEAIEGDFVNSIHLHMATMESRRNSLRTKDGVRQGYKEGYWMHQAPFGYINVRDHNQKSTLAPHPEKSLVVREAFEKLATGIYSVEEIRRQYCNKYKGLSKQSFLNLCRKIVYTGKIQINAYKDEPLQIVRAKHPPIISEELFYKVQAVIDGKTSKMVFNEDNENKYPLKRFFYCLEHNRTFTASTSKGRNNHHSYYHCTISKCKNRFSLEILDDKVKQMLSKLNVREEVVELYKIILEDVYNQKQGLYNVDLRVIEKNINGINKKINELDDKFLDGKLDSDLYTKLSRRLSEELTKYERELTDHKSEKVPFKRLLKNGLNVLPNISQYYENVDGMTKQKILGSMFDGKLEVVKKEVRTVPWKETIVGLFNLDKEFEGLENKKTGKNTGFSNNAPPLGVHILF
ncbi:MAG TPA: hypothetical protein DD806_01995 [Flavobacterium sp.]|nr:hypothetical protein [Flavobacterium sp.]